MEVITIDSQAYKELVSKINAIAKFVIDHQDDDTVNPDEMWVDSYEVCTFLKISERTLQRLRSNRLISYSIISGKSYYTIAGFRFHARRGRKPQNTGSKHFYSVR